MAGGIGDTDYWAYGAAAERIAEDRDGGTDTLWYMAGPDDFTLHVPANIEKVRIATVVARDEGNGKSAKTIRIVAHPDSPIHFETSERVSVNLIGSRGDDVLIGARYASSTFYGGAGDDEMIAVSARGSTRHFFYGGAGRDTLRGGAGRDVLDGGTGDDLIFGGSDGANRIFGGHGNDDIRDGRGSSLISTGPGRNRVTSAGGNDTIEVGTGENDIAAGPGQVTFRVAYGGVTRIRSWIRGYRLDLTDWPAAPEIMRTASGLRLQLGLSVIDIGGIKDPADLDAAPEPAKPAKRAKIAPDPVAVEDGDE
jgi:Ca2+-binding RTX toxin-like protein